MQCTVHDLYFRYRFVISYRAGCTQAFDTEATLAQKGGLGKACNGAVTVQTSVWSQQLCV